MGLHVAAIVAAWLEDLNLLDIVAQSRVNSVALQLSAAQRISCCTFLGDPSQSLADELALC